METAQKPIGIFDSGIGGLTVVKKIIEYLPNENIVYFGDTARVPYGSKSNDTIIEYSIQDTEFLLTHDVKAIVVACNTASSMAIPALKEKFNLPIISMIEPGSQKAAEKTKSGKIGVIGTRSTISNKAYSKQLKLINREFEILERSCPLFVPLAEEGWIDHPATFQIASEYLTELKYEGVDTLILGCTHYPILRKTIQKVMGESVQLIDSGVAAAYTVQEILIRKNLLNTSDTSPFKKFYVSDIPSQFKNLAELFLGMPVEKVAKVDLEEFFKKKQG
ncbi:MAG: glutamate racemase [Ignavibacteriaceae bacterium]|nr:glutamate racemase [Ignavibacteriaceae bacterium]MCK6606627.1 glutamate racemase [Ignavibacteriaceae bacterium]